MVLFQHDEDSLACDSSSLFCMSGRVVVSNRNMTPTDGSLCAAVVSQFIQSVKSVPMVHYNQIDTNNSKMITLLNDTKSLSRPANLCFFIYCFFSSVTSVAS